MSNPNPTPAPATAPVAAPVADRGINVDMATEGAGQVNGASKDQTAQTLAALAAANAATNSKIDQLAGLAMAMMGGAQPQPAAQPAAQTPAPQAGTPTLGALLRDINNSSTETKHVVARLAAGAGDYESACALRGKEYSGGFLDKAAGVGARFVTWQDALIVAGVGTAAFFGGRALAQHFDVEIPILNPGKGKK